MLILYRKKQLASWLQCITDSSEMIKKSYYYEALLRYVTSDHLAENLYNNVIEVIGQLEKKIPIELYPEERNQGIFINTQHYQHPKRHLTCMHTYTR